MAKLTKPIIAVNIDGTVRVLNQDPNVTHFNWYTRELLSYNITSPSYDTIVAGTNESAIALPNSSYNNRVYITENYRDTRKFTFFKLYEGGHTSGSSAIDVTELYVGKISEFEYSISIPNVEYDYIIMWDVAEVPADCIVFIGETSDFTLKADYKEWNGVVQYSTDKNMWFDWQGDEISSVNMKLYLRGKNNTKFYTKNGVQFVLSANAGCYGNINTLLDYENPPIAVGENCYRSMFYYCAKLVSAPALPATTLGKHCYQSMFSNCKSLTSAPELPATTLADSCYEVMFGGCTSLTTAPELPATTTAKYCYQSMFGNCKSLTSAPELPATTITIMCYAGMFHGCTKLVSAPALPATTVVLWCYQQMFQDCTSLTTAPALPATTLGQECYKSMFQGCTSLKVSETQTEEYATAWRIPSTGEITSEEYNWNTNMLANTGGTFKGNPSINTTYYGAW